MRGIERVLLAALVMVLVGPHPVVAQTDPFPSLDPARTLFRPGMLWAELGMTVIYDTNYRHDDEELEGPGLFASARAQFRSNSSRPFLRLDYRGQMRQFNATTKWNRHTHLLAGTVDKRLGPLGIEGMGSWQLSTETEDREVADIYLGGVRISLRMGDTRLRLYGRHRLRKFQEDPENDETILSAGAEFRWKLLGFTEWEIHYRHEESDTDKASRRFQRQTLSGELRLEFGEKSALVIEGGRRSRRYPEREALVNGLEVPTEDSRWVSEISLHRGSSLGPHVWIGYEYQMRTSNDPERDFEAHRGTFSVRVPFLNWAERSPSDSVADDGR